MNSFVRLAVVVTTLLSASLTVMAQAVRGTIERVDGNVVVARSADGGDVKLTLAENATIVAVLKASMADIKEGTYLGSAAMPQADGSQKAIEIHIFPDQMRGAGEGHRPYAPVQNGTMTNGSTSGPIVTGIDGTTIVVKYREGEKKIVVSKNTPIVRYEVGGRSDLKPGARFTVSMPVKKADGSFEASRINVGRDGAIPQ